MRDSILYYPAINLPNNEWSIKSLLYWNEVGVIVPYEFVRNPDLLGNEMREMVQAQLVNQIISDEYMGTQYEVSKSIIEAIQHENFDLPRKRANFKEGKISEVHKQKFRTELFQLLVDLKIASKFPDKYRYNWYFVEEETANLMMSYLAAIIAKNVNYTPATDNEKFIKESDYSSIVKNDMNLIRSQILKDVMPYPENPEFSKLVKFKEKYFDQLLDLRRTIEKTCLIVLSIPNMENREQLLKLEIDKINDGKEELIARLKEGKLGKIALGTFKGMLIDGAIALITGDVISPAATLFGGINQTIKEYNGNPIKDDDLAYLALIDQRLMK